MFLQIDYNSGEPICRQVTAQIKLRIVGGLLRPGDRLPSIRELARTLKINPTTVSRIYSDLAHAGVLTLRQGQGAFVADSAAGERLAPKEVRRVVGGHARSMLVEGLRLGLSYDQVCQIVDKEYQDIKPQAGDNHEPERD